MEVKTNSGTNPHHARKLEAMLDDIGTQRGFLIGMGAPSEQQYFLPTCRFQDASCGNLSIPLYVGGETQTQTDAATETATTALPVLSEPPAIIGFAAFRDLRGSSFRIRDQG